jgi:hypothetical protein
MGDGFGQLDRPIHRVDLAWLDLDPALLLAVGAIHSAKFLECHLASPFLLDRPTELLPQLVGGYFNFVKMRHPTPLLKRLNLGRRMSRFLQLKFELLFELASLRVHAIPSRGK